MEEPKFYTIKEVQKMLRRRNPRTIYRYIKEGELRAKKIHNVFYIEEKDLEDFINGIRSIKKYSDVEMTEPGE